MQKISHPRESCMLDIAYLAAFDQPKGLIFPCFFPAGAISFHADKSAIWHLQETVTFDDAGNAIYCSMTLGMPAWLMKLEWSRETQFGSSLISATDESYPVSNRQNHLPKKFQCDSYNIAHMKYMRRCREEKYRRVISFQDNRRHVKTNMNLKIFEIWKHWKLERVKPKSTLLEATQSLLLAKKS